MSVLEIVITDHTCHVNGCQRQRIYRQYCQPHYRRWRRYGDPCFDSHDDEKRFWSKVTKTDTCWLWTASGNGHGYGVFFFQGRPIPAHRYAYELLIEPIAEGLQLDHLCRVRHCVNPSHLEPVNNRTNSLRGVGACARNATKTHCKHGHPFAGHNLIITSNGWRKCRTCRDERNHYWNSRMSTP
jgi:hypothetical protein